MLSFSGEIPCVLRRFTVEMAICKSKNGESENRMRGMIEILGIRAQMQGIMLGMR